MARPPGVPAPDPSGGGRRGGSGGRRPCRVYVGCAGFPRRALSGRRAVAGRGGGPARTSRHVRHHHRDSRPGGRDRLLHGDPAAAQDALLSMRRRTAEREPGRFGRSIWRAVRAGQRGRGNPTLVLRRFRTGRQRCDGSQQSDPSIHEALREALGPAPIATALLEILDRSDCRLIEARAAHAAAVAELMGGASQAGEQLATIGYAHMRDRGDRGSCTAVPG